MTLLRSAPQPAFATRPHPDVDSSRFAGCTSGARAVKSFKNHIGSICGPCGYPNKLFPVWDSSGPLLGPCWAFLRHFVGPLERARGSVWPSWDFLCVTREAFPHSRRAVVDSHPKCRNQHWRSHGKRSKPALAQSWKKRFSRHQKASGWGPRRVLDCVLGPWETPIWSRNGSPEGSQRGSGGVSEPSWFGVPS